MPRALAEVRHALALDDTNADAHSTLGILYAVFEHDWQGAQTAFRRAIELNPASALARIRYAFWLLRPLGRFEEAAEETAKALELDPLSPYARVIHAFLAYYQRRFEVARERSLRALDLDADYYWAHLLRALSCLRLGAHDEALAAAVKVREILGDKPLALSTLGTVHAGAGRRAEARAEIERLEEMARAGYVSPTCLVWIYCGLGELDAAWRWIERGVAARDPWTLAVKTDPVFDPLRQDPRMTALVARMNL